MPRAKYSITKEDLTHAYLYLSDRLRSWSVEFIEEAQGEPESEFDKAVDQSKYKPAERVVNLNAWCEKYLPTDEWTKLKHAIRKRRQRQQNYGDQTTVTISTEAHKYLSRVAERDDVTLSEAVEYYLQKAWNSSRSSAKSMRYKRSR